MTKTRESSCFKPWTPGNEACPGTSRREIHLECSLQHIGVPGAFSQFNDSSRTWAQRQWGRETATGKCCSKYFLQFLNNKVFLFSELSTTRITHSKQSIKCKWYLQGLHWTPFQIRCTLQLDLHFFFCTWKLLRAVRAVTFSSFFKGGGH